MRKISLLCFVLLFILPGLSRAQEKSSLSVSTDVVSRYVWRGLEFGNSHAVQPTIEYAKGKFAAGFWGSYALNGANVQEADLYISYSPVEAFSLTLTDYFFPDHMIASNNYFEYTEDSTGHLFEGSISFNGTEKIPFTLMAAVNFYGADARNMKGDKFFSTYVELGYSTELHGTPVDFFLGAALNDADEDKGEMGFYGDDPGIINLGMSTGKDIRITEGFTLPMSASLIFNPQAGNVFMVVGISL